MINPQDVPDLNSRQTRELFGEWPQARHVVFESGDGREFLMGHQLGWITLHRAGARRIGGVLAHCYNDTIVVFTETLRERVAQLRAQSKPCHISS